MNETGYVILAVIALVVVFFIIRDLITWYFKINRGIELLESINDHLSMISGKSSDEKENHQEETEPEDVDDELGKDYPPRRK